MNDSEVRDAIARITELLLPLEPAARVEALLGIAATLCLAVQIGPTRFGRLAEDAYCRVETATEELANGGT